MTPASAISANHGSANGASASMASSSSEKNGWKTGSAPTAKLRVTPSSTPARPAMKAEMQNTISLVVVVLRPMALTAVGESDIPCSIRPSRLRCSSTSRSATSTSAPSTT